jgi:predicted hydrocarbon binding protein
LFRGSQKKEPRKDDPFDVDVEHGTIKRKADGIRMMAVGSVGWATIEKELSSTFMTGSAVILQRMGYSNGRYLGRLAKTREVAPAQTYEALQNFAMELGYGEMRLVGGDLYGGQARILVKNCFFCLHIRESTDPVCHLLSGVMGGVADEIIGATHRVVEEKCVAKGDNVCEFLVERVS